jgi:hypothetical protein
MREGHHEKRRQRDKGSSLVMIGALVGDLGVTLAGQPASYWHRASTVHESNRFVKPLLASGAAPTLLAMLVGVVGLWYTASVLPKKWALILILAVTMSGYFGISSWLVYDYHLGSTAEMIGAVVVAAALVVAGVDARAAKSVKGFTP